MVDMMNAQEINLENFGETMVNVEFFDKRIKNVWGGQQVQYRYEVSFHSSFFEGIELFVTAVVRNEPFIELEFVSAETLVGEDEMLEDLLEKHELLLALSEAFYR